MTEPTIIRAFDRQVGLYPDAIAYRSASESVTYTELRRRSGRIASALIERSPAPGERVGIRLPQGVASIAAFLGILEAGKIAVPLDYIGPDPLAREILADAGASWLIGGEAGHGGAAPWLPAGCGFLAVRDLETTGTGILPPPLVDADAPAVLVYTSGSTGRPKGVLRTHGNLVWNAGTLAGGLSVQAGDRYGFLAGYNTGNGVSNLFRALLNGATILGFDLRVQGIDSLAPWLRDQKATLLSCPASVFRELIATLSPGQEFHGVRMVGLTSEPVQPRDLETWRRHFAAPCVFGNTLSSTETGVIASRVFGRDTVLPTPSVPIGWPAAGVRVRLLDASGGESGEGESGEIVASGPGIAAGYWNQEEATARVFRRDADGSVWFHTGDMASRGPDGCISHAGRRDFRIKVRGHGVELEAVEAAVAGHPGVRDAAVAVRSGTRNEAVLVAFVVPVPGSAPGAAGLRRGLQERLPEPMVPASFVFLEKLPRGANGKVDRRALAEMPVEHPAPHAGIAPRTPTEERLAGIWSEVLGPVDFGVDDGFHELGGHSLSATRVLSRITKAFEVSVPLRDFLGNPTIKWLAGRIDSGAMAIVGDASALRPRRRDGEIPLSFAQQRFWFLEQFGPGTGAYNVPWALRLRGRLDRGALMHGLHVIVGRHESLRTVFRAGNGDPVQIVLPDVDLEPVARDLSGLAGEARESACGEFLRAEARRPFDLERGPLVRVALAVLGTDDHVLLVTLHHIVCDRWSKWILTRELAVLYKDRVEGREPGLPALPLQYGDFATWQRERPEGPGYAVDVGYWKRKLAGLEPVELPGDRPRSANESPAGATMWFAIDAALVRGVAELARREGTSPFAVAMAAFQVLLHRHTGQSDLAVGTAVANRHHVDLEGVIGLFINMLVIRGDLSGNPPFRRFLHGLWQTVLEARDHQELPFERLVEELHPGRSLGRHPLFQVLFLLQNMPTEDLSLPGLAIETLDVDSGRATFDLSVVLMEEEGQWRARWEYNSDLFDAATIRRMAAHYLILLESVVSDPECVVGGLPMLAGDERRWLLETCNRTESPLPGDKGVHHLFAEQVARAPGGIAVEFGERRLTYTALDRRARALAARLRALGVGPDVTVGVYLERSENMVAGLLGILMAGGVYLPLDPNLPAARLERMLGDARPAAVLVGRKTREGPPGNSAALVWVEEMQDEGDPSDDGNRGGEYPAVGASLAYILYTSGSTGQPKGVAIPHRALVNFLLSMAREPGMGPGDRMLAITTIGFDIAALEIFLPLITGARVVLASREQATDGKAISRLIDGSGATVVQATPATWRMLVESGWQGSPSLRFLTGGEALPRELAGQLLARCGELWNLYGPTETTVYSLGSRVAAGAAIVIGRPLANTRAYILDALRQPVPVGVAGELHVGGEGLARGYVNQPGLTADKFVPDPFAVVPGERMYRTGDLARWRSDGTVEYLGRIDHQVKLRGFRIEPAEIESALAACPGVLRSTVVLRKDARGDERLVAYIVPVDPASRPAFAVLARQLRSVLPDYMVPTAFVALGSLPLTPGGKLDRRALPEPDANGTGTDDTYMAPATPVQERLAGIWGKLLGVERPGLRDDFFEAGGHSLLAMRFVARVRNAWSIELPIRALFEQPSLGGLAERVEALLVRPTGESATIPRRAADDGLPPLSFAQQRLWFLDRFKGSSLEYNMPEVLSLRGALDADALERAFNRVVARHQSLRTRFNEADAVAVQVVAAELRVPLPVEDLSGLGGAQREASIAAAVAHDRADPFDLERGPLLRVRLLRLGPAEHLLLRNCHHIISDGWSREVFDRELEALYAAYISGGDDPLPPLAIQYPDYAVWQRQWLSGAELARQIGYWRGRLADAPALELPLDRPRPAEETHKGGLHRFALPAGLGKRLREFNRMENATPFMTMLGAFQILLSRLSGQNDILVGTPIANRRRLELEALIGFLANTLVLRLDLSGVPDFREIVARVRRSTLDAFEHQDLPFEKLVEELNPARDLARHPFFQVLFGIQDVPPRRLDLEGLEVSVVPGAGGTTHFDLELNVSATGGDWAGYIKYNSDLFDTATIARMAVQFGILLGGLLANPDLEVSRQPLMEADERRRLLSARNPPRANAAAGLRVHETVALVAADAPGRPAATLGDASIGYGELVERADRLARRLIALGVGPDVPVGLCVPRTLDLPVAVLGILRAGGACVPLDPELPDGRLALMLADARPAVVVVQPGLEPRVGGAGHVTVPVDASGPETAAATLYKPRVRAGADDLAYILFTSGSTGRPKGVAVPHRTLENLVEWQVRASGLAPGARTLQFASPGFDVAFQELFATWCGGGTLVMADEATRRDAAALARLVRGASVARVFVPFAVLDALASALCDGPGGPHALREVITAGEALRVTPAIRSMFARWPGMVLVNQYGPTETHVATAWTLAGPPADWPSRPPIGHPVANTSALVLDGHLQPVPIGVAGELYLGGDGLARGYVGSPSSTAARFVADPFDPAGGARLYRTGDWCRRLPDGAIEFLHRRDDQVKIRGHRVETGEVASVLGGAPGVRACVVSAEADAGGDTRLVAHVVPMDPGSPPERAALRDFVRRQLPDAMIPAGIVFLPALPLTANGKVDRRALPSAESKEPETGGSHAYVAPRTPVEDAVAGIWRDVLGTSRAGIHDDFFASGGHSLMAMRLVARVRAVFSVELPVRTLFQHPTLGALAGNILALGDAAPRMRIVPLEAGRRAARTPLSFAQQRLWFLDELEPGGAAYNISSGLRLRGPLDAASLALSLRELVRRHQVLRTTFPATAGEPEQVVGAPCDVAIECSDLRELPEEARLAEARRLSSSAANRPFDLARDPMLRALCLRLADDEHELVITVHHIAADGWSLDVLWRELGVLYSSYIAGRPSPMPELPLQYADYAAWQREWLRGDILDRQLAYWKERMAGAPPLLELPTDFHRPASVGYRGERRELQLAPALGRSIRALGRREGTTLFMTLLAAWASLLCRLGGQDDVVVGTPIGGRTLSELEGLVGFFVNTLALRVDLAGRPTFRELLRRVREVALGAYAHPDLPFERLVEELRPERHSGHAPLFQAMLLLQPAPGPVGPFGTLEAGALDIPFTAAKFDLTLSLREQGDGLRCALLYNTELFEGATIVRWLGHFERLLQGIARDPDCRVGELPLLSDADRRRLLEEWNPAPTGFPGTRCVHELFADQARLTPAATAVVHGGETMTYIGLDGRANRRAHELRARGVSRGSAVAVHLERSADLLVAVLAILKCGACYVPLAVDYPAARKRFILEDCRATVVIGHGDLPDDARPPSCIDIDARGWASGDPDGPAGPPSTDAGPCDPAYVIYTSGSAGEPRGVVVGHRAIARLVFGQSYAEFGGDRVFLQLAPVAFDASTFEIWGALLHGAKLVVAPESPLDLPALGELIRTHGVTTLWMTVGLFNEVIDTRPGTLEGVREILTGGDALSPRHVRLAQEHLGPRTRIINGYGPTECTTFACCHSIPRDSGTAASSVSIGRPIANTLAYVLDARGELAPIGVPGELYLGGPGLADGYLNNPRLTAERFVADPFSREPGARMYRTGDRVRWLPDGTLDFLGRGDFQVKIRGFRVELGEIERVLEEHPAVEEVVVDARAGADGGKSLVAYWKARPGQATEGAGLAAFARERLPAFMMPGAWVELAALPLTRSGKIDRRALPEPTSSGAPGAGPAEADSIYEAMLARHFAEVLGRGKVGLDDNFFACGGHSLAALRLLHRIEEGFGVRLPPRVLFEAATVRTLSVRIQSLRKEHPGGLSYPAGDPLVTIQEGDGKRPLFLFPGGYGDESEFLTHAWICQRHLGPDFALKAFRNRSWRGAAPLQADLRTMARDCIADMRRVQGAGPWHLVGLCVGSTLAHEVALQLQESGEEVAMLAMGDAPRSGPRGYWKLCRADSFRGARQWISNTLFLGLPWLRAAMTASGRRVVQQRLLGGLGHGSAASGSPEAAALELDRHLHSEWCHYQNGEAYLRRMMSVPRGKFRGRLDLMLSGEHAARGRGMEWASRATGGAEVLRLPGSHATYQVEGGEQIAALYLKRLGRESGGTDAA